MSTAIFVLDCEASAHGRNFNVCRLLAAGAVVIESSQFSNFISDGKIKDITPDMLDVLIPKENRFVSYIHDIEAISQFESSGKEAPIWKEDTGREFWMNPKNKKIFNVLFERMK